MSEENPQCPMMLDPKSTLIEIPYVNDEQVVWIDPDRPPLSTSDLRKLKNQAKSKALKTPEELAKIREEQWLRN